MRRMHRIVLLVGLVALAPVLVGCESFDLDKLDVFGLSEKKKLPGDRKAVFPEGVPGVSQGIPPEYIKGNQPPETAQALPAEPAKTAAVEPANEAKPKPKRKPKPRAPAQPAAQGAQQPAWPAPDQQQPPQQARSPWPGQGQSTSGAPYPPAPASGTFSR
jgi:hypothetical protein